MRDFTTHSFLQEVEAVLYAVTAIAENVDLDENAYLPQLFRMLSAVPFTNYKLISQALYLIGMFVCSQY